MNFILGDRDLLVVLIRASREHVEADERTIGRRLTVDLK
jgi:hypothetical protein